MGFGEAISTCFRKYVDFSGRARRSEYWYFTLFYVIISVILGVVESAIETQILGLIVGLVFFLPNLAVSVRRMHDIDRSGWWVLIGIVPLIGWIVFIIFCCTDSKDPNRFGENPKGMAATGAAAG